MLDKMFDVQKMQIVRRSTCIAIEAIADKREQNRTTLCCIS